MNSEFIKAENIFTVNESKQLQTIDQAIDHLRQREGLFHARMANLAHTYNTKTSKPLRLTYLGWEKLERDRRNRLQKYPSPQAGDTLFTGFELCSLGVYAIKDALKVLSPQLTTHAVQFRAIFDENEIDNPLFLPPARGHLVLRLAEKLNGQIIDPTYAQLRHIYAGKFLIFPEEQMDEHYPYWEDGVYCGEDDYVDFMEHFLSLGFTQAQYQSLIRTLL